MRSQTTGLVARMSRSRRPPDSPLGDKSATFISITPRVYTSSRRRQRAPTASPARPAVVSWQATFHEVIKTSRLMRVQGRVRRGTGLRLPTISGGLFSVVTSRHSENGARAVVVILGVETFLVCRVGITAAS